MAGHLFELTQLRVFVAVAEELNFRRAARRLNMTQPPISRHVKLLEDAVGVRLLDRTNRSVRLTAAGARFLIDAVDILRRAESAALFARQAERGEEGAITLGFVPSASIEIVPRIVTALRHRMPGVTVTVREMMTFEQVEALLAGSLDIGLFRLTRRTSGLEMRRIWSEPFVLAAPKSHPLATKAEIALEDLDGIDFIGYSTERGGFLFEIVQGYLMGRGVSPNTLYGVSQGHTVMSLVNEGLGVGIVPRSNRLICMPDTVVREMPVFPHDFRSDLYMALGPAETPPLVARVAAMIEQELAEDRLDAAPAVHHAAS